MDIFGYFGAFFPTFYRFSTTFLPRVVERFRLLMPKLVVLQYFTCFYKHNHIRRGKWHHEGSESRSRVIVVKSTNK